MGGKHASDMQAYKFGKNGEDTQHKGDQLSSPLLFSFNILCLLSVKTFLHPYHYKARFWLFGNCQVFSAYTFPLVVLSKN